MPEWSKYMRIFTSTVVILFMVSGDVIVSNPLSHISGEARKTSTRRHWCHSVKYPGVPCHTEYCHLVLCLPTLVFHIVG